MKKISISKRKQTIIVSMCVLGLLLIIAGVFVVLMAKKQSPINSFQECTNAGYPIQLSYPERCSVPGGKTFTND